jgi:hypothetical protein
VELRKTNGDLLDSVRIAEPCAATWENMRGDDRLRYCALCELHVYNFAAMPSADVRELLTRTDTRVCARVCRRADGTLLTRDSSPKPPALWKTISRFANSIVAGLLSALTLVGCATDKSKFLRHKSTIKVEIEDVASQEATLRGTVVDAASLPLPGVTVVAQRKSTDRKVTVVTDVNGTFDLGPLPAGVYRVEVKLDGFASALVEQVSLKPNEAARASVTLRYDSEMTVTVGVLVLEPVATPGSTTTRFTPDPLRKLPL